MKMKTVKASYLRDLFESSVNFDYYQMTNLPRLVIAYMGRYFYYQI